MRWTEAQLANFEARRWPQENRVGPRRRRASRSTVIDLVPEGAIHEAVAQHLRTRCRPGVHWHHPATGELRDPGTARKLARMGVRAGLPDFLLLISGRLHGLELKRERGGRLSPDQISMHRELREAGAIVETAHGLDDALETLKRWGVFLPRIEARRNAA